jgi:hypothetical protein
VAVEGEQVYAADGAALCGALSPGYASVHRLDSADGFGVVGQVKNKPLQSGQMKIVF